MKNLTWRKLNEELISKTEEEVKAMLIEECAGERRSSVIERLHQRYTTLRASRERIELLQEARKL